MIQNINILSLSLKIKSDFLLQIYIHIKYFSKKFDWKYFDSYMIIEYIEFQIYHFNLLFFMKIYFIFHIYLLKSYKLSIISEWICESLFLIIINNKEKWEIEEILNSELYYHKFWYKIYWINYSLIRDS